jgi:TatD family-associated radical SAM protein
VGDAETLWLEREPTREEIWEDISKRELCRYSELVFCGFGEPTLRLDDLLWVARRVKAAMPALPVRINTNGHANLIAGRDVTPELEGCIDALSISLNRANAASYNAHMKPVYGEAAYEAVIDFAVKAKEFVPGITLSVVDVLDSDELVQCRDIALQLDLPLRIRGYH